MSLIIEDKNALNVLANTIIGANKSITDSSATKSGLVEMINNIIPEKSKFSSGVVMPATEINISNMPEIPFNLGNDDNGKLIVPDMIFIYQSEPIKNGTNYENCSVFTMINPNLPRVPEADIPQMNTYFSLYKIDNGNRVRGTLGGANSGYVRLTDSSFYLAPHSAYSWKVSPIVWIQIAL